MTDILMPDTFNGHVVFTTWMFNGPDAELPCPNHQLVEMGNYGDCTGIVYCIECFAVGDLPQGACTGEPW